MKKAFITGVTGQDGAYLAKFLLGKGYRVHGLIRRNSTQNFDRLHALKLLPEYGEDNFTLHTGDLMDQSSIMHIFSEVKPDEIYNLAAQSFVGESFYQPELTANVDGLGLLRILESVRCLNFHPRIYQASTSELFGKVLEVPQNEKTPFYPRSPYGVAKMFAHWTAVNYREAYNMYIACGILFNHESPLRGEQFVTRKITRSLAKIACGKQQTLRLGNLDAKRDWGHARDYVEMQWLMLQKDTPSDYVIATGEQYSVRQFVDAAVAHIGVKIKWSGSGIDEKGVVSSVDDERFEFLKGKVIVEVSEDYFRPAEVDSLLGNPLKAKDELSWVNSTEFSQLVEEMMKYDLQIELDPTDIHL